MKTVTNAKLIKRNAKIGQYTSLGALDASFNGTGKRIVGR